MIVLIDGLGTSGKSVIKGLLDGHSRLFLGPNHDMVIDALCNFSDPTWLEYRDTMFIRELLNNTYYYQLEWFAQKGCMELDMSTKERKYFPFHLDFYKFDKIWMVRLKNYPTWTVQLIAEEIFRAMLDSWSNYPYPTDTVEHFVGMGFDRPTTPEQFIKHYPDGKMIYMVREVEAIIAIRSNRQPVEDDLRSLCLLETTPRRLLETGHVQQLKRKRQNVEHFAKLYPDRIKIVHFDDLVYQTESTMRDVAAFLGIEYEESMTRCTFMGEEMLTPSGKKYVGSVLDDPKELLTPFELQVIQIEKSWKNALNSQAWKVPSAIAYALKLRFMRSSKQLRMKTASLLVPRLKSLNSGWQRDGFF